VNLRPSRLVLLFVAVMVALFASGSGCWQIIGLENYSLCKPATGAGGCGGESDGGPAADADAAR
jgi:hypothetical protein